MKWLHKNINLIGTRTFTLKSDMAIDMFDAPVISGVLYMTFVLQTVLFDNFVCFYAFPSPFTTCNQKKKICMITPLLRVGNKHIYTFVDVGFYTFSYLLTISNIPYHTYACLWIRIQREIKLCNLSFKSICKLIYAGQWHTILAIITY